MRLSQISVLIPLIFGALRFSSLSGPYRTFYAYIIMCALMEAITGISVLFLNNNLYIINLFCAAEFLLLSFMYWEYYRGYKAIRITIPLFGFIFMTVFVCRSFFVGEEIDTFSRSLESFFLIAYVLTFLGLSFTRHQSVPIWKQPFFWINTGILIYFSLTLFFFLVFNLIKMDLDMPKIAILHSALNILAYLLYAKAFRCFK